MEEVQAYLKECGAFFIATTDGDNMAVLYITNGAARFCSFSEPERTVNF